MIEELFGQSLDVISQFSWAIVLIVSFLVLRDFWLLRLAQKKIRKMDWVLLELNIPPENIKTPQSMEQVIASMHGSYTFGLSFWDKYVKGEVEAWFSLEIVGFAHSVHFYIRTQRKFRNMIEAAFYSQYPSGEIYEVEDYVKSLPRDLPNRVYEVFGTDWKLSKEEGYPIQTYRDLEIAGREEEQKVDPVATMVEAMSNLKEHELMVLQLLIRPTGDDWHKGAKKVVEMLMGREKEEKKSSAANTAGSFMRDLAVAAFRHPDDAVSDSTNERVAFRFRSPGEENILKAVERKMGKVSFESLLRFVYIDRRDDFTDYNVHAAFGALRQFYTFDMNFFTPNMKTLTLHKKTFKYPIRPLRKRLLKRRRKLLYRAYRERAIPSVPRRSFGLDLKDYVMSAEEIATIFHPPGAVVKAPKLQPLPYRKGEPPVDLPIKIR